MEINKILHFVWIGDEALCPHNCIQTWREQHSGWEVKIWGNEELHNRQWINKHHMTAVAQAGRVNAVADLLRWEILLNEGGFAIDADSVCIAPLPEWVLSCELVACWENELNRPGLISNGMVGVQANNTVIAYLVENLRQQKNIVNRFLWYKLKRQRLKPWKTTGPQALTNAIHNTGYPNATILPSHLFIPIHYSGQRYTGNGPVICSQLFSGTGSDGYAELHQVSPEELKLKVLQNLGRAEAKSEKN